MIEIDNEIMCSRKHRQPIQIVLLDEKLTKDERLLCNQCTSSFEGNVKMIGFSKLIQIIENDQKIKTQQTENLILQTKSDIELVQKKLLDFQNKIKQQIEQLIGLAQQQINYLDSILQSTIRYSFFQELDNLIKNNAANLQNEHKLTQDVQRNNYAWLIKMKSSANQFMSQYQFDWYQELNNSFQQLENSSIFIDQKQQIQQDKIGKQNLRVTLINKQILQQEYCRAISFNNTNQIMISTSNSLIKVFKFENETIQEICKLEGHSKNVNSLIFSKFSNSFISGSTDSSIRCWQPKKQFVWTSSKPFQKHTGSIYCIIINQNESELISGGDDKLIIIWKLNMKNNELVYQTELNKHSGFVHGLSLNQSENYLVSCDEDQKIIVWKKFQNNWTFDHIVKKSIDEFGHKVKFLRDDTFIWVSAGFEENSNATCVFELQNNVFQEIKEKQIELHQNQICDSFLFPIQYIPKVNLIIIRHKCQIYLIRETNDRILQLVKTINCKYKKSQGTITNDGQFLIFWDCEKDQKNGSYQIYRIQID